VSVPENENENDSDSDQVLGRRCGWRNIHRGTCLASTISSRNRMNARTIKPSTGTPTLPPHHFATVATDPCDCRITPIPTRTAIESDTKEIDEDAAIA
jgi:hypothetical protein